MTDEMNILKIPPFSKDLKSKLTVNRLPLELPSVIGVSELEVEYGFDSKDSSLDWPVDVYTDKGVLSGEDCDSNGVGSADMHVFTYIHTVTQHQKGRPSPWLLSAVDTSGLVYADETAGLTKGPALPIGDNSPYLFTPAFIPAIDIPGVTSPRPEPEEPEEPVEVDNINLSVRLLEHGTATDAKSPRSVCDSPDSDKIDVLVECSYNVESGATLPANAVINLVIQATDSSIVTLYPGTGKAGASGKALTARIPMAGVSFKSEKFTFNYSVNGQVAGSSKTSITATAEITIPEASEGSGWHKSESAVLELECVQDGASDLFDYTVDLLDINRSPANWNREDCNTECVGEACRELVLKVDVTKKHPNTVLDAADWRGEVLLYTSPTDGTIFIGSAGSSDSDILSSGSTSLSPYSLKLPLAASTNSATTYIEFQYVTNFQCTKSEGSGGSAAINCDLKIYNTSRSEADDLLSVGDIYDTSHKVKIECTCEDCSKTAKDNLDATLALYEHDSSLALKLARKVCEDDLSSKDSTTFDAVVSVAYKQPTSGCKLNLTESCVFLKIMPSNSTVRVRSFPSGEYEEGISRRVALSDRGGTITAGMAFEYSVYEKVLSKSWTEDIVVSLEFLAVSDTGKSTVHKITEKKIRLRCSADESTEDCVEAMSASILLYEAKDDVITTTEAKKTRAHCNADPAKDKQPHFFIVPVIDFPDGLEGEGTNSCKNIVSGTGTLIISANGTQIGGYRSSYKDSIIKVPIDGRLSDIPDYHLEYTIPAAGEKGKINIRLEISGTYVNSDGEQISWNRAAEETVTVKCGEDSADPDPEDSCGILDKLKAGDGIDISDCNSAGERTISATAQGVSCESLKDVLAAGTGINIADCDSNGKLTISATEKGLSCSALKEVLKEGDGINISECSTTGTLTISAEEKGVSCSDVRSTMSNGSYISLGSCGTGTTFSVGVDYNSLLTQIKKDIASMFSVKQGSGIKVTKNTDGSYTIALAYTVTECK